MKKIIKKIEHELRGLRSEEKEDIISYYVEMINDRLDNGEKLEDIEKTIEYSEIRKNYYPKTINERENKTVNDSLKTSGKLLLYLFASPLLIPIGLVYLVIIIVMYILILSSIIVMVAVPFGLVAYIIGLFRDKIEIGNLLISSGVYMVVMSILVVIFYNIMKWSVKVNNALIKVFSRKVLKRGEK
ncbi:DUF1700 domain-containing protein [Haploplasma axanthum]|uniref:Predicted membrane protein n=1 Tax=Haploplasma axanthum TaxID=29552 RepID=A0A449BEK0_HAPAX|nr:DUF1700 domain-containing protein [Haploplasma axanthum]VEU80855.1 Predicted membrane protein [Haploplasma axanthum]